MVEILSINFDEEGGYFDNPSSVVPCPIFKSAIGDKPTSIIECSVHWESLNTMVNFLTTANTITRGDGKSWITLGFRVGDIFQIIGGTNPGQYTILNITSTVITTVENVTTASDTGVDFYGITPINDIDHYFNLIENNASPSMLSLVDTATLQKKVAKQIGWGAGTTLNLNIATVSKGWDTGSGTVKKKSGITGTVSTAGTNVTGTGTHFTSDLVGCDIIINGVTYVIFSVTNATNLTLSSSAGTQTNKKWFSPCFSSQKFTITHTFIVNPVFLSGQESLFVSPYTILPPYFSSGKCLKYICQIDAKVNPDDPNIVHTGVLNNSLGNTGWFNEFLNGGTPNYTLNSISYKDVLTNLPVDSAQINRDTKVTISLHSINGNFHNISFDNGTAMTVNMLYSPLTTSDYINTITDFKNNFKYDRALINVGNAPINGEEFGTPIQSLKNISATFINANTITITFTISYSSQLQTFLKSKVEGNRNYLIWITPDDHFVNTGLGNTDRVAVLADFNSSIINLDDPTLIEFFDTSFYQYRDTTTCAYTDYKGFIYDGILSRTTMLVKKPSQMLNMSVFIEAFNLSTGSRFDLERITLDFTGSYGTDNEIVNSISIPRGFKLHPNDPRNLVTFDRDVAIDTPTQFGYELDYGAKLRYEEWRKVSNFDAAFALKHTENWSIYSLKSGWEVRHVIQSNINNNGNTTSFEHISNIKIQNSLFTDDGFGGTLTQSLETSVFNGISFTSLHGFILKDNITHVKMTINGNFTTLPPAFSNYYGILSIDIEQTGGYTFVDQVNTDDDPLITSIWLAKAILTKVSNSEITIEANIDKTKINKQVNRYLLSGHFGFTDCNGDSSFWLIETGSYFLQDDGSKWLL